MKKVYVTLALAALALAGCSKTNNYAPAAGASNEDIYKAACFECHKKENDKLFELTGENATASAVAKKVTEGGLMMPSFPNIKGEALAGVSQYVIDNSAIK